MGTILFAPKPQHRADANRMLAVAQAGRRDFVPEFFGYSDDNIHTITRQNFYYYMLKPVYTAREADITRIHVHPLPEDELRGRVESELALYKTVQPRAVVTGLSISAALSSRIARIPRVGLLPFDFTRPFFETGLGIWPDQARSPLINMLPDRLLDWIYNKWMIQTGMLTPQANRIAAQYGLPPFKTMLHIFEARTMLIVDMPESVDFKLPQHWHSIGPVLNHEGDTDLPDALRTLASAEPIIYLRDESWPSSAARFLAEKFG